MENKILVFNVQFKFIKKLSNEQINEFFDKFLKNAIESNNLRFGGGGEDNNGRRAGVVETESGINTTERDRKNVSEWLNGNSIILEFEVGPIVEDRLINERDLKDLERLNEED